MTIVTFESGEALLVANTPDDNLATPVHGEALGRQIRQLDDQPTYMRAAGAQNWEVIVDD